MRKVFRTIIFGAAIIACSCNSMPASFEETGHSDADWKLVFEENFDGSEVNASVWSMYDGPGHAGHGLRSPEAFTVEDGCLVITGEMKNGKVVSGGMAHKENYLYNTRWEFRARCDEDPENVMSGVVLTWPESNIWPDNGELDIFETLCQHPRKPLHTFFHYGSDNSQTHTEYDVDATQWQNMALEWFEDAIYVYLNGERVYTITDKAVIPSWPHHICLQLDAFKHELEGIVKMQVDYVRIYKCDPSTHKHVE
jgi:glycosyl hydrolases family 16